MDDLDEAYKRGYEAGCRAARHRCWELVNSLIKPGALGGNGFDASAQSNGLILAANFILSDGKHG